MGDYTLVRFDITESNPAQRALLDRYQLLGRWRSCYSTVKGDEWRDLRVVGEVDAATFANRLECSARTFLAPAVTYLPQYAAIVLTIAEN